MADNDQTDTISKESFERVTRERDSLQEKLDKATGALAGVSKRDKARAAFRAMGAVDPDAAADLATPFLDTVEDTTEAISEALAADRFKLLTTTTSPPSNGDGETEGTDTGDGETPATESAGGFTGPSPAGSGSGSQQLEGKQKIKVGSPEYLDAVAKNDEPTLKKMYDDGLIEGPSRPWR